MSALSAVGVDRLVAANIKRHRTRLKVSAPRLALALSVPSCRIREIEQGLARVRVDTLVAVSAVLGVALERFFEDFTP